MRWLLPALALTASALLPAQARAARMTLPLAVHVATADGAPVVDAAFVDAQVARANAIFAPHGVGFAIVSRDELPAGHARLDDRPDRHALGAFWQRGAIHCFFVSSLMDVDEPGRVRRGVHWRSDTHAPAHFVIVSAISWQGVLAHELGHFLGNPRHSPVRDNLMSYDRSGALPTLDAEQVRRMQRRLRRYRREGELSPLPETVASGESPGRAVADAADD